MGHVDVHTHRLLVPENVPVFKGAPTDLATGHVDAHVDELQVFKGAPTALATGF